MGMGGKVRIGIFGYGHLGKGAESEISKHPDFELVAIFTRRAPACIAPLTPGVPVVCADAAGEWADKIDVMLLCGGSAADLPAQGPKAAKLFNTVDSFDTHAKIPEYLNSMDAAARSGNHISIISAGWDPGLFSLMRLYMGSVLPAGKTYSFWGYGVSQGHSDAIRRIEGVENAVQYTVPNEAAAAAVRRGGTPELSVRQKHTRLCYVAPKPGADLERIKNEIINMPYYFSEYDTTVHFISNDELIAKHSGLPHGGSVIRAGNTGGTGNAGVTDNTGGAGGAWDTGNTGGAGGAGDTGNTGGAGGAGGGNSQVAEFTLKLDSNPEFTASVMLTFARAAHRLYTAGERGARTVFDIPPVLLSYMAPAALVKELM